MSPSNVTNKSPIGIFLSKTTIFKVHKPPFLGQLSKHFFLFSTINAINELAARSIIVLFF